MSGQQNYGGLGGGMPASNDWNNNSGYAGGANPNQ